MITTIFSQGGYNVYRSIFMSGLLLLAFAAMAQGQSREALDLDGDSLLTAEEFEALPESNATFQGADLNNDRVIDALEWRIFRDKQHSKQSR